jgi:acetyl-CoA synthetase
MQASARLTEEKENPMTMQPDAKGMYSAPPYFVAKAHVDAEHYDKMYAASVSDPDTFWGEQGLRIDWIKPYTKVKNTSFEFGKVDIKWFEDGTLNVSANCIDRHMISRADPDRDHLGTR